MSTKIKDNQCLLLNADYSPLRIISWQKAIVWSIRYTNNPDCGIQIIDYYKDKFILGACGKEYKIPCVARTSQYFNLYNNKINFSRHNLFIRDKYTCQYCGQKLHHTQLTYDHIIPKSRFNNNKTISTNWNNVVTACRPCNHKKGNRTPTEAGMTLLNTPIEPTYSMEYLPWFRDLTTIYRVNSTVWEPFIGKYNEIK
jgi:hypothetical protein